MGHMGMGLVGHMGMGLLDIWGWDCWTYGDETAGHMGMGLLDIWGWTHGIYIYMGYMWEVQNYCNI